jgi:hypothetical protein
LTKAVVVADEKKRKKLMLASTAVVAQTVLLPSTAWCIPHMGVTCTDLNSSKIGAIAHNINSSNNNNNHSSSTVLLLHHCNRLHLGHHNRLPTTIFRASTVEIWDTLPANASLQSRTTLPKLRQPWSTSRRTHRGVLHHGLAVPTTPPWRRFPRKKKC